MSNRDKPEKLTDASVFKVHAAVPRLDGEQWSGGRKLTRTARTRNAMYWAVKQSSPENVVRFLKHEKVTVEYLMSCSLKMLRDKACPWTVRLQIIESFRQMIRDLCEAHPELQEQLREKAPGDDEPRWFAK